MFQQFRRCGQVTLMLTIFAMVAVASARAQNQPMIPITPRPGSSASAEVAGAVTQPPIVASGTITTSQGNSAWRAIPPSGAGYRIAANPGIYGSAPGFYQQPTGYDPFGTQSPGGYGVVNAGYGAPVYQVAQVPQAYPQTAPVYVPQSYVAPSAQPYLATPAGGQYGMNTFQPLWTAQLNWLYMTRSKSNSFPLLIDGASATVVDADQLDYGWKSGFDVALSRRWSPTMNFELRYFQIRSWNADFASPFPAGSFIATNPASPLFAAGDAQYMADSNLHSFEMNFVRRSSMFPRTRLAIGFRWLELSDNLLQTFLIGGPPDALLDIDTNNHMYGLQIASDGLLFDTGRFSLVGWIKGGIYANVADQSTFLSSTDGTTISYSAIGRTTAAFMGETGLMADFSLFPRVSLVGGYQLIYIAGAALAPDQLPNMSSVASGLVPVTLDQSDPFYHGALVGIDIHW
jgi:hypothetical protein